MAATAVLASSSAKRNAVSTRVSNPLFDGSDSGAMSPVTTAKVKSPSDKAAIEATKGQQQMVKYTAIFEKYDADGSGTIDKEELGAIFGELGTPLTQEELDDLMRELDDDGNGTLDFKEFLIAAESRLSQKYLDINKAIEEKVFGANMSVRMFLDEGEADMKAWCGLRHPQNVNRKIYDIIQMLLLLWTLIVVPVRIAFAIQPTVDEASFWVDVTVDSFFMFDLIIQGSTYYLSGRSGQWVSNGKKIRRRYFRSWFIVDFVAVFPTDYLIRIMQFHQGAEARSFRMLRLARLLRYARLLKFMNMKRMGEILAVFQGMIGWNQLSIEFIFKILILCIMFVCFNHLGALTFLLIGREYSALIEPYGPGGGWWDSLYGEKVLNGIPVTDGEQYVDAVYFVMMTLTSVGYGDITPKLTGERLFVYIMMFFTAFFYAYVIGTFADLIANKRRDKSAFEQKMRSVFAFLELVECPDETLHKVRAFYQYRYPGGTLFDEHEIFAELPNKLKNEVVLHRFERTIHNVPFFRNCPEDATSDICLRLRGHTSAPDDTIMTRGEHSSELIIMERGEATGADGSITIKLDAGSFFGELQFLGLDRHANMDVKADSFCEFYTLRRSHILDILESHPDLNGRLMEYSKLRKEAMEHLKGDDSHGEFMGLGSASEDEDEHHEVVDFATRVSTCPRSQLEAALIAAVANGKLVSDDLQT